jgi:hypothetical protein
MKRFPIAAGLLLASLLAISPVQALAASGDRVGDPQSQPNPSSFATNYQDCLGPLRSKIAQGDFAGVGPFGQHFTGSVDPGAHYGTVGEAAFLEQVLGLDPSACATLIGS